MKTLQRYIDRPTIDKIRSLLPFPVLFSELYPSNHRKTGNSLCPFHADTNASFQLSETHGYCHAGCVPRGSSATAWDIFALYQEAHGTGFYTTVKTLATRVNVKLAPMDPAVEAKYLSQDQISTVYSRIFQVSLRKPEPALVYLEKRRKLPRSITVGRVGYLPWSYQPQNVKSGDPEKDATFYRLCEQAGLLSKLEPHNFLLRGHLVIPIYRDGRIVSLYGRLLKGAERPHIYPRKTDPPMPQAVWLLDGRLRVPTEPLYLCESILDGLTLCAQGLQAGAIFGTAGLSRERLEHLRSLKGSGNRKE